MRHLLMTTLSSAIACGGLGQPKGNSNNNGTTGCTVTIAGEISGTNSCNGRYQTLDEASGAFDITVDGSTPFSFDFEGDTSGKDLTIEKLTDQQFTAVTMSASNADASKKWRGGFSAGASPQGTATLNITSTGSKTIDGDESEWEDAHGTLDATLEAATGASSTVTVHVSF